MQDHSERESESAKKKIEILEARLPRMEQEAQIYAIVEAIDKQFEEQAGKDIKGSDGIVTPEARAGLMGDVNPIRVKLLEMFMANAKGDAHKLKELQGIHLANYIPEDMKPVVVEYLREQGLSDNYSDRTLGELGELITSHISRGDLPAAASPEDVDTINANRDGGSIYRGFTDEKLARMVSKTATQDLLPNALRARWDVKAKLGELKKKTSSPS